MLAIVALLGSVFVAGFTVSHAVLAFPRYRAIMDAHGPFETIIHVVKDRVNKQFVAELINCATVCLNHIHATSRALVGWCAHCLSLRVRAVHSFMSIYLTAYHDACVKFAASRRWSWDDLELIDMAVVRPCYIVFFTGCLVHAMLSPSHFSPKTYTQRLPRNNRRKLYRLRTRQW